MSGAYVVLCDCDSARGGINHEVAFIDDLRTEEGELSVTLPFNAAGAWTKSGGQPNRRGSRSLYRLVCPGTCGRKIQQLSAATAADVIDGFQSTAMAKATETGQPISIRPVNAELAQFEKQAETEARAMLGDVLARDGLSEYFQLPDEESFPARYGQPRYVIPFGEFCAIISRLEKRQKRP